MAAGRRLHNGVELVLRKTELFQYKIIIYFELGRVIDRFFQLFERLFLCDLATENKVRQMGLPLVYVELDRQDISLVKTCPYTFIVLAAIIPPSQLPLYQ